MNAEIVVQALDEEPGAAAHARAATTPSLLGAATINAYSGRTLAGQDLTELAAQLEGQVEKYRDDQSRAEEMLIAQAHSLDAIFNRLALLSASSNHMSQLETYLKLALKAQNQTRTTWEAVARMRNPSQVAFVKQANIAQHQEINNEKAPTRVLESETVPSLDVDGGFSSTPKNRVQVSA